MSVRIEQGGKVTVFAGSDKRPIATASVPAPAPAPDRDAAREPEPNAGPIDDNAPKSGIENLAALLGWIDSLGASGLDGHDLAELGLKSGMLTVDDQRNGKRWNFENIDLSLMRSKGGNVVFKVESANEGHPGRYRRRRRRCGRAPRLHRGSAPRPRQGPFVGAAAPATIRSWRRFRFRPVCARRSGRTAARGRCAAASSPMPAF